MVRVASRGRRRGPSSHRCQLDRDVPIAVRTATYNQNRDTQVQFLCIYFIYLAFHSLHDTQCAAILCRHPPFRPLLARWSPGATVSPARWVGVGAWTPALTMALVAVFCDARGGRRRCASSDDGAGHAVGGAISGRGSSRRSGRVSVTTATDWHGGGDAGGSAGANGSPSPRSATRASWGRRRGVKVVARRENQVTVPDAGLSQTESGDFMS